MSEASIAFGPVHRLSVAAVAQRAAVQTYVVDAVVDVPLTHAIRVSVRLASSFHAFFRSLAQHSSSRYLCTVSICRHYYIVLPPNYRHFPPNPCQFAAQLPPFPHDVSTVPARHPRRSRTASSPYPHDAPALIPQTEQPFLPCRRQAATRVSRPCSRIFTCGEMEIATSHIICRGVTISMPEELGNLQALASAESFE